MTDLLDGNVLVALSTPAHVHHEAARRWFGPRDVPFATTPITQGTLLRVLIRGGLNARESATVLEKLCDHRRHTFWIDDIGYDRDILRRVTGHAGVTDAYLVALARARGARIVTFDHALAATYPDVTDRIESPQG